MAVLQFLQHPLLDLIIPDFVKENTQLILFFGVLTYVLFLLHWIVSTDWEAKFNWSSLVVASTGLLWLHYSNALLVLEYELLFVCLWTLLWYYHVSTWRNNYAKVRNELESKSSTPASLRPFRGSVLRFLVTLPRHKTPSNQWEAPPFRNAVHLVLVVLYGALLCCHVLPFVSPLACGGEDDLCCRYNYVAATTNPLTSSSSSSSSKGQEVEGERRRSVDRDFCSGHVRVAFAGAWSTGKTTVVNELLGHNYSTSQIAPAPTTDKFVCITAAAPYDGPVRSDDFERRRRCSVTAHANDATREVCGEFLPATADVADTNAEFEGFVLIDTPGWQAEYGKHCAYRTFYRTLLETVDFVYVVWDLSHGKIEDDFAALFRGKARGTHYDVVYNRYDEDAVDMAFLNQQHAKIAGTGQELLTERYVIKIHDRGAANNDPEVFREDVRRLRDEIKSVNRTVHDNRKRLMRENLLDLRSKTTGLQSLRKIKIGDRLIREDLDLQVRPKKSWLRQFGIEL